jgi:hypothetical protein
LPEVKSISSFDRQAEWLIEALRELDPEKYTLLKIGDTRAVPECELNPGVTVSLDNEDRLGFFGVWSCGLCDYIVIAAPNETELANYAGLEATEQTVPRYFSDFLALLQISPE